MWPDAIPLELVVSHWYTDYLHCTHEHFCVKQASTWTSTHTHERTLLILLQTSAAYVLFYRQRDTRALRKSVSMDQSCESLPVDVPDDAMEAETKADEEGDQGMVSVGLSSVKEGIPVYI